MTQYRENVPDELRYARQNDIVPILGKTQPGLGRDCIHHNWNSGAQAINFAYLMMRQHGFRSRIILLGFDMQRTMGLQHFFGDHPQGLSRTTHYESYVAHFTQLAKDLKDEGVEVINCSRQTKLHQFERATLDDVL